MNNMLKELAQYIVDLRKPEIKEFNGIQYTDKHLETIKMPLADSLKTQTLTSIVDYINKGADGLSSDYLLVHILNEQTVLIYSRLLKLREREQFIHASAQVPCIQFGRYMDLESFNIMLQSQFIRTETVEKLLKLVGNITDETVMNASDDGVTQKVTVRKGIVQIGKETVPNPVVLQPYRTFSEAEQPESSFVYRFKSDESGIYCALFEGDGGAWKSQAIQNIKKYLEDNIERKYVQILA